MSEEFMCSKIYAIAPNQNRQARFCIVSQGVSEKSKTDLRNLLPELYREREYTFLSVTKNRNGEFDVRTPTQNSVRQAR